MHILHPQTLRPCQPNPTLRFERWLGRPLSRIERSVIHPIEHLRLQNRRLRRPTRLYIDDPGTFGDSIRQILILYTRYIATQIHPQFNTAVISFSKKEAFHQIRRTFLSEQLRLNLALMQHHKISPEQLQSYRTYGWQRRLIPQFLVQSTKFVDNLRGHCFQSSLILDADRHGHSTRGNRPDRYRIQSYRHTHRTTHAIIPSTPESITLIHGNPDHHPRHIYANMRRQAINSLNAFTVITPSNTPYQTPSQQLHDQRKAHSSPPRKKIRPQALTQNIPPQSIHPPTNCPAQNPPTEQRYAIISPYSPIIIPA